MTLDDQKVYSKYDASDVGFGIENLPEQIRLAWRDTRELEIPRLAGKVQNILLAGMGGSGLGAHLLEAALPDRLKIPFFALRDYALPGWVDSKSLVILSSFSGNTEEVLTAAAEAKKRRAKVFVICAGGTLAALAKKEKWPIYEFVPGELAKQPRFGIGLSFGGVIGLLERTGLLKVTEKELQAMMQAMHEVIDSSAVDVPTKENPAKTVAEELVGNIVLIFAAEHLTGVAHVMANALNETAKHFATYFALPEMNHHLLEGFTNPKFFGPKTKVVMLSSGLYNERTQLRVKLTAELCERQGTSVVEYVSAGKTKLEEVGEIFQFASYVAWYMAMLNKANTMAIPFVDELKDRMKK